MALKTENGLWINKSGKEIHPDLVKPLDKKRDKMVTMVVKWSLTLEKRLAQVHRKVIEKCEQFLEWQAKQYDLTAGKSGSITLADFSNTMKIKFTVPPRREFDDKLDLAKSALDAFLKEKMAGADLDIQAIVNESFNVDKKGKVDTDAILRLRELNITHPKWKAAMNLINESLQVSYAKRYVQILVKEGDQWRTLELNFSSK